MTTTRKKNFKTHFSVASWGFHYHEDGDRSGKTEDVDYDTLLKSLGAEVVEMINCGSWQGDSVTLLKKNGKFGFVVFGYGSCSGCDALEACDSLEELEALRDSLEAQIKWGTAKGLAAHLDNLDPANHWWMYEDETKAAVSKIYDILEKETENL